MATNPMQRKARNSFLLGMLITLLIAGVIIAFLAIQLKNKLDKEKEEVIAIGDNMNDKKMIENAGLGIAMKGSTPLITKVANDIAVSNDEDGVAKILQKYYKNINF
jgi:hydroxymethylpyrimidine pyrophosphatase-like HAD family hydrolase